MLACGYDKIIVLLGLKGGNFILAPRLRLLTIKNENLV